MTWAIKDNACRSRLHIDAGKGMVLNEYTGEVKQFSTHKIASDYAKLSLMRGVQIKELR